jgi:predicted restriction endonuclease
MSYVRTIEHREKMRKIKTGQYHTKKSCLLISLHHHNVSGKNNPMFGKRGKLHPAWKGGICKENEILRKGLEFRTWRKAVYERDNYTCQFCGKKGGLNADHIKPWSLFPKLRFDINNGRTLCIECHKKTDSYCGKMNRKDIGQLYA